MFKKSKLALGLVAISAIGLVACTSEVNSKPNFLFKKAPNATAVIKFNGKEVSHDELFKGSEAELYEAQLKVYELKLGKVKAYLLENFKNEDPARSSMTMEQFIDVVIAKDVKVSDKEINEFAKERNIPDVNPQLKARIVDFLRNSKKREAIEAYLTKKTKNSPVEIYLERPKRPRFEIPVTGKEPMFGGKDAAVVITEYSDFQCPYCAKGVEIMNQIKKTYGNKVKIVFKNFPLSFHKDAAKAAEAALCANEQAGDKFWKLHDSMFADQSGLSVAGLKSKAKTVGLDQKKFDECLDSGRMKAEVDATVKEGIDVGVQSTPTFYVNGMLINGAQPFEVFKELIDSELGK
ncbi:DsbA family protein [Halobacteriovorax sp. RT-2-4]|uniref:DsbA family protein n=1 Tax=unclassified Halobacteriovorax TaxID=2639665 RepID=UPI00399985A5